MYLEMENATKIIDKKIILNSVSIAMERGKIYGIKGKNGSGKTMLIKSMCGLIHLNQGEVRINGKALGKGQEFPPSVGALIENPGFIENYSGYKNLELLASIQNIIGENEIRSMMEKMGLDPFEKKKVKKYSLGMKQKLGIVAAVMEHPELILLDEPTNALDMESVGRLNELLEAEKKRNALVVISSHDLEELEMIADNVFVIENGKIMKEYETK
ncbi:MAG: ATP-binding cassette domain-containing protein [Clostridiales bacterium]|nr:ATP-binding cassette domain-containing protein [Clostridiales bacterium]